MKKSIISLSCLAAAMFTYAADIPAPADDPMEKPQAEYIISGNGLPIRQAQIEQNEYNLEKYAEVPEIKLITIHNTAEPYTAMQERTRVNLRTSSVTSFQFAVDENEAVQILPDNTHGWHAGDGHGQGNMASIGIEICRSQCIGPDNDLYTGAEENAVKLVAYLLKKYNLTVDDLRMHYDWTKKHCPHRILDAQSWDSFKARVAEALKTEGENHKETRPAPATPEHDMAGINISTNRETKKPLYNTQYGKDFDAIDALIADLQANKITEVIISCWIMDYDAPALIAALNKANITVEACYVPQNEVPDWVRKNLIENK